MSSMELFAGFSYWGRLVLGIKKKGGGLIRFYFNIKIQK